MSSVRSALLKVLGDYLDGLGMSKVSVDIPVVTDNSASVYITVPAGMRDELDEVAIYNDIARDDQLADIEIELDIIDEGETKDALEGAIIDPDAEEDSDEEDELSADNLTIIDPDGSRKLRLRDMRDEEEDDYEDDSEEDDEEDDYSLYDDEEEDVGGIDEYEPTWSDLEDIMKGNDEDY